MFSKNSIDYKNILNIGVYPNLFPEQNKLSVDGNMINFISLFGNPIIITDKTDLEQTANILDFFVLPGGADVNPLRYREPRNYKTQNSNDYYEEFDTKYIPYFIEQGIGMFGICRGFQSLNVLLGGSLEQHIEEHNIQGTHTIGILPEYDFQYSTEKSEKYDFILRSVNSRHHQAITRNRLASNLIATHFNIEINSKNQYNLGNIVEGYIHKSLPIAGVQWHPEDSSDIYAIYMFDKIIRRYLNNKSINKTR